MSQSKVTLEASKLKCGVIMPISSIDTYSEAHWVDVRDILFEAIEEAGFEANLVSNADDIGIIQKRIIQNIYENPIVVCDVSGKNPNVMFELGLRLAFDKPTIIIKDDQTSYSFDTAPIEHLVYPKDLRFNQIIEFRSELIGKIKGTHHRATTDPHYTTFLKNFGNFTIAKIDTKEIPSAQFIIEELQTLRKTISEMNVTTQTVVAKAVTKKQKVLCVQRSTPSQNEKIQAEIKPFGEFSLEKKSNLHFHFNALDPDKVKWDEVLLIAKSINSSSRLLSV